MRWTPGGRGNIDDQRGRSGGMGAVPMGIGGVLVLLVLSWFTGVDFLSLVGNNPAPQSQTTGESGPVASTPQEEKTVDFVDAVIEDTQKTWEQLLGSRYERTRAVLFRDGVQSGCGAAPAAVGPFYCPGDKKVYLDLSFFNELQTRFAAPGEFAQAYVLAHEVGHHVQTITGVESQVRQRQASGGDRNALSVRMELQADCFAGVWGYHANKAGRFQQGKIELDPGDLEQGLRAASAIGDDTIQKQTTGQVRPDRFTHGSSAQRVEWFKRGFDTGDPQACNTFQ
ncbi:MAG TPA: neutral zinc metallopeptidase [Vicinamibacterales bacterium]|nr:neutral zinc metallopeptidase [Vicinamibacterales bacterium]